MSGLVGNSRRHVLSCRGSNPSVSVSEPLRRKVHRIYGTVCLLQIVFGVLLIVCGILSIVVREHSGTTGTPYFIFAFSAAILVCIDAGYSNKGGSGMDTLTIVILK